MPNENNNPNQIILVINAERNQIRVLLPIALFNTVNLVQEHNAIQDKQLADLENRISVLETNCGHQVCQNEYLQNLVDFYCPPD